MAWIDYITELLNLEGSLKIAPKQDKDEPKYTMMSTAEIKMLKENNDYRSFAGGRCFTDLKTGMDYLLQKDGRGRSISMPPTVGLERLAGAWA